MKKYDEQKECISAEIKPNIQNIKKKLEQEWSSMESSSYENWDEIEMLFGHLVIGNLQFVICN